MKIGFVSLGCPKNQLDTEVMLNELRNAGYEITPEEYSFLSEPVTTVAICAVLVCTDDLSEDVVYNLTKTLFDKKAEITTGNAKGEYLDPAYAVEGNSVPYHPGAIRYYEEVGVM